MSARVVILGGTPAGGSDVNLVHVHSAADGGAVVDEYVAVYDVSRVTPQVAAERVHAALGDFERVQLRQLTARQ